MINRELPLLGGIAACLRWLEELANILAGPLLTAGLAIALIDLLTDGALLTAQPALLYAWAISQAVGVDAQLVGAWDKARLALRSRRYWSLVGLLVLGCALAYVAWLAAEVFSLQQSEGLTTTAALARLGLDSGTWLVSRAALSVVLVCLSGWTRYHAPAVDRQASAEEEAARLQQELRLEPYRQELRALKARHLRVLAGTFIGGDTAGPSPDRASGATGKTGPQLGSSFRDLDSNWSLGLGNVDRPTTRSEGASVPESGKTVDDTSEAQEAAPAPVQRDAQAHDEPPTKPPTGGGTPARRPRSNPGRSKRPAVLRLQPVENAEQRVRAVLNEQPAISIRAMAKQAGVSTATASKYARLVRSESGRRTAL